jgi:acyl-CoA synthetase (AMP-forming)/AMP-acid ligase II
MMSGVSAVGKVFRSELNPVDFLYRAAYMYPDKTAVASGKRRYSYSELAERSWRLANALRSAGLVKGDRVATLLFNSPAMLEAHFGVPAAGGILVTVNHRLSSAEVGYILAHSGARYLLLDTELEGLALEPDLAGVTVIRCADTGVPGDPYEEFLAGASPERPASWLEDEEETISINYTSGTTGRPKGVQYTYRGAYLNALNEVIVAGLGNDSAYLWTLPMFHCNGWCFPWAVTAVAARHVTMRAVDPELIWELIDGEGVTHYNGAPTVQLMVINHPRAHRLEHPVTAMVAAAPPSPTLLGRMSELNFRIVHVYGLTETYGPITMNPEQEETRKLPPEQRARFLARQGQAYISSDLVRVVDGEMNDVPQDAATMGEVIMRGNNVMSGYFDDDAATAEAFAGGWFHSGDLAVWHPDGNIELRDRGKDIIISGGENISSIEVEQAITAHPAVLECAVIGVPHSHWGERPKAYVTLNEGAAATAEELIAFCRERLAHYKCPDAIEFGPLPKTSTGKVQKFVLRSREWPDADQQEAPPADREGAHPAARRGVPSSGGAHRR